MKFLTVIQVLLLGLVAAYVLGLLGSGYGLIAGLAALAFIALQWLKVAQVAKALSDHVRAKVPVKPGDGAKQRDSAAD